MEVFCPTFTRLFFLRRRERAKETLVLLLRSFSLLCFRKLLVIFGNYSCKISLLLLNLRSYAILFGKDSLWIKQ
uniref:Histone H2AX n=1 Tax=Rhizophora mucronata TaxID=61149 RepID=A0A2P2K300_RHIMU